MNISNFNRLRINSTENFVDIATCGKAHSNDAFMITAYDFTSEVVEVRRKGKETCMFVLNHGEISIPDDWKDAEVVFTTRKGEKPHEYRSRGPGRDVKKGKAGRKTNPCFSRRDLEEKGRRAGIGTARETMP